jgi:hypothetical protein
MKEAPGQNVPVPELSLAIFEEMASRMALQQSSASGAYASRSSPVSFLGDAHWAVIQIGKNTKKTYPSESSCRAFAPSSREDTMLWSRGVRPVTCRWSVDSYLRNEETRDGPTPISKEGGARG